MMRVVNLWKKLNAMHKNFRVQDGETSMKLSERSRELIPERR